VICRFLTVRDGICLSNRTLSPVQTAWITKQVDQLNPAFMSQMREFEQVHKQKAVGG